MLKSKLPSPSTKLLIGRKEPSRPTVGSKQPMSQMLEEYTQPNNDVI